MGFLRRPVEEEALGGPGSVTHADDAFRGTDLLLLPSLALEDAAQ